MDHPPDASASRARGAVAIVPARGGSKRIPRKNIRPLSGVPLMAWTISMAVSSGVFERVIVTTDDDEIAQVGREYGAETPFKRGEHLADDHTPTVDVISDALERTTRLHNNQPVCCLYPSAVFTNAADLRGSLRLLGSSGRPYVAAVSRYAHPIQRAFALRADGGIELVDPAAASQRTQDLEPRYHDAGQFYWGTSAAWLNRIPILGNARGFELPEERSCDIDNERDWLVAQALHTTLLELGQVEMLKR